MPLTLVLTIIGMSAVISDHDRWGYAGWERYISKMQDLGKDVPMMR